MFKKGDLIQLTCDVGKYKKGTSGTFRDYIDSDTVEISLQEEVRYVVFALSAIEKVPEVQIESASAD